MTTNEPHFFQMMEKGHSAVWDQDWETAADFFRRAVVEKPEDFQALTSLGFALFKQDKFDEARTFYLKAAKLSPDEPMPIEKLAQIYQGLEKFEQASELFLHSAYLYLKEAEVDKAIQIWQYVTEIDPGNIKAHSRIAYVAEKINWTSLAIYENIYMGSILQDLGQVNEAFEKIKKAISLDPHNEQAINAFRVISANQTLEKPNPDEFDLQKEEFSEDTKKQIIESATEFDINKIAKEAQYPIVEARQTAVVELANLLFEASEETEDGELKKSKGIRGLFRGQEKFEEKNLSKITKFIGSAIDNQSRELYPEAIVDLLSAVDLGLNYPAVNFLLGYMYTEVGEQDRAHPVLMRITDSGTYALAVNLLIGKHFYSEGIYQDALIHALNALKWAEISIVKEDVGEILGEQYENLIQQVKVGEEENHIHFYENIVKTIDAPEWRKNIMKAKEQIPIADTGTLVMPIAEILQQAGSALIIEGMAKINDHAQKGYRDTALEEAYSLLIKAPGYLPLQVKIADMLIDKNRIEDALEKFGLISQTYYSRGEIVRAKDLLLQVVEISPLHLDARHRLKDIYRDLSDANNLLSELLSIADIYYKLANLDDAKECYLEAAEVADDVEDNKGIKKKILSMIADIDIQKLQWREALDTYKTMREIDPGDKSNWKNIVDLNIKLGNDNEAAIELDECLSYFQSAEEENVIQLLQEFIAENPKLIHARKKLSDVFIELDLKEDAIKELDEVVQLLLEIGNTEEARTVVRSIIRLGPPNEQKYLDQLKELG